MSLTILKCNCPLACVVLALVAGTVVAEDHITGWQDTRERLAKSNDPAHKKLVARWDKAIGPQNWAGANGKTIRAKWSDFFDESQRVRLVLMDGNKEADVYNVPFDQLAKASQTRHTQILKLLKELEEAAQPLPLLDSQKRPDGTTTGVLAPAKDPRPPLKPGEEFHNVPWFPDKDKWRTDYNEFAKSFGAITIDEFNNKYELKYGSVKPFWSLKQFHNRLEAASLLDSSGDITNQMHQEISAKVRRQIPGIPIGDVMWECTLTKNRVDGDTPMKNPDMCQHYTDLAPFPEPFQLRFLIDINTDTGFDRNIVKKLDKLPARVRFIGTIHKPEEHAFRQDRAITLTIRFPDDQPAD